jgi:hypothetical protein
MARSIRRFNRAAESTLNPIVEASPQTGEALEAVMIRASVRECQGARGVPTCTAIVLCYRDLAHPRLRRFAVVIS